MDHVLLGIYVLLIPVNPVITKVFVYVGSCGLIGFKGPDSKYYTIKIFTGIDHLNPKDSSEETMLYAECFGRHVASVVDPPKSG